VPNKLRLKRVELYEKVWTTPFPELAREYGVSSVRLGHACRKLGVPRPKPGFWKRKQQGKRVHRAPLKRQKCPEEIVLSVYGEGEVPPYTRDPATLDPRIRFEQQAVNRIEVAETLEEPHRCVAETEKSLRKARVGARGYLVSKSVRCLDLRVSEASLDRALRVANALVKALEDRGFAVEPTGNGGSGTRVDVLGELTGISIQEVFERRERPLTPAQERDRERAPWKYRNPEWDYLPTGRLTLRILDEPCGWRRVRLRWTDGKRGTVENYLNRFIIGLVDAANNRKANREEWARWEREREEQRRREAEQLRLRQEEQARVQRLETEVANWHKAQLTREYVAALWNACNQGLAKPPEELCAWVAWACRYADRIDPLHGMQAPR